LAAARDDEAAAEANRPLSFEAISELPERNGEPRRRDKEKRKRKGSSTPK
jgi:hypothetical protein